MKLSANLGFLWRELPLPEAVWAAHQAGFDAVECHWPYATPSEDLRQALDDTGLPLLCLNTAPGDASIGEFGLCALPGRSDEARASIDQAVAYARQVGAGAVHVMSGKASGAQAYACFVEALTYAAQAAPDLIFVIEPINAHDVPGYFLCDLDFALRLLGEVSRPNVKLMFDCYHIARMGSDLRAAFEEARPWVHHIQIAGLPDRGAPDAGDLDYVSLLSAIKDSGWDGYIGAEYKPDGTTEASLKWLQSFKQI